MGNVRVDGVKIRGKNVTGAEIFADERKRVGESGTGKSTNSRKRDPYPGWSVSDSLGPSWPFTFTIAQLRKWWRFGVISEELMLMQCSACGRGFTIVKEYYNGKAFCPYCKKAAQPVVDQATYLTAMCKHVLKRDGKAYAERRS